MDGWMDEPPGKTQLLSKGKQEEQVQYPIQSYKVGIKMIFTAFQV